MTKTKLTDKEKIRALRKALSPFAKVGRDIRKLTVLWERYKAGEITFPALKMSPENAFPQEVVSKMDNIQIRDVVAALEAYEANR